MSPAEFARMRGVSRQAVSAMVKRGTLAGSIRPDGRIDVEAASRLIGSPPPSLLPAMSSQQPVQARLPDQASDVQPAASVNEYADARARRETAQARMAELELAETEGRLIDRNAAERSFEDLARRFRDRITAVAAEVAEDCARLDDPLAVEARVTAGIEAALLELSRPVADDAF
jgi:hypothetical protein